MYEIYSAWYAISSTAHQHYLLPIYLSKVQFCGDAYNKATVTMKHGRLQRGFTWEIPHIPTSGRVSYRLPLLPHISQPIYTYLFCSCLPLLLRLLHSPDVSLSATMGAKCLPQLHLAVIVRAGVVVGVAHRPRPVLRLEIPYAEMLQTMEQTFLLREQMIPLQRYEFIYSPTRTRY